MTLHLFRHTVTPSDHLPKILFDLQRGGFCFEPPGARRRGTIISGGLLFCRLRGAVASHGGPDAERVAVRAGSNVLVVVRA
jgi:hypothetical protein